MDLNPLNPSSRERGTWWARALALTDHFAYPLRTSHYVELVNPLWASHRLQARVVGLREETAEARTLTLKPGLHWRGHRPGQHLRVGVAVNGLHYTRTYSISSPPERGDGCFTITVKAIAGGRLSEHLVRRTQVGDYLPIGLPQGDFHLPDAQPVRPLFITAGSGITPVMSMLRSLCLQGRLPDTVHLHYAPTAEAVIFGAELAQMAERYPRYHLHRQLTRTPGAPRFEAGGLDRLCPDWREREIYACGPQRLLAAVEAAAAAAGRRSHLHIERFRAALVEMPADAVGGAVTFHGSGRTVQADHQTPLLRVAEDAGLNPPHGCRMGICHSCTTRLRAGCVRDLRSGRLIHEPGSPVQTCVCAAAGDCELEL